MPGKWSHIALWSVLALIPTTANSQAPTSPLVTLVRREISPPGPTVGSNYRVLMEVRAQEAGVVRARIEVPAKDRVISQMPQDQYVAAGQSAVFTFTVYCGESGGLVRFLADRLPNAPAAALPEIKADGRFVNYLLANTDAKDAIRPANFARTFQVRMQRGRTYVIDMVSTQIDPFLRLENPTGQHIAQDDDSGGFPNARITFLAPEDGLYRIVATSFAPATGGFSLMVREQ
jgi:hypothetical protein